MGLYEEIVRAGALKIMNKRMKSWLLLSGRFMTGTSAVLGVSSFYDFLHAGHIGKKVFVCDGTACLTSGKQDAVRRESAWQIR